MSAKALFIVAGLGVQLALPRVFGSASEWGRYSTVAALTAIVSNTLVAAMIQTVSRRVSERDDPEAARREGLLVGAILGIAIGGGFAAASPLLAIVWQRDPSMTPLFAITSIVVASYAIYAAVVGGVNGRQRFGEQARLDALFSILRATGIVTGSLLGAAAGGLAGFSAAALAITVVALLTSGPPRRDAGSEKASSVSLGSWLADLAPIAIYQAALNGVLQLDQPLLRAQLAELALDAGQAPHEVAEIASRLSGYYRAAQSFAFVPYQLIIAVAAVVLPTIAAAKREGDRPAMKRAIEGSMRLSLLLLLGMAAPVSGAALGVMRVVYPAEYGAGAGALQVLALALVPFALFHVGGAALVGAGRSRIVAASCVAAMIVVVIANRIAVQTSGLGLDALRAAALATAAGMGTAMVAIAIACRRELGGFIAPLSAVRASIAAAAGLAVASVVPHQSAPGAIAACAAGAAVYALVLVVIGEVGRQDLGAIAAAIRRR